MYDPKGETATELTPLLMNELTSKYNIPDDARDVAEYINVLIGQNKSAAEICHDVKEIVPIDIDENFVGTVFAEIGRIESTKAAQAPQAQDSQPAPQSIPQSIPQFQPQQQAPQVPQGWDMGLPQQPQVSPWDNQPTPAATWATQEQPMSAWDNGDTKPNHVQFSKNTSFRKNTPSGPSGWKKDTNNRKGGVGKDYTSKNHDKRNHGNNRNTAKLEKALSMTENPQVVNIAPTNGKRCKNGPNCHKPQCPFVHTTDHRQPVSVQIQPQVVLCKYGILCSKELCPFGHPTPANKDAKVTLLQWCRNNKECTNPKCQRAHSSPNYQAPPSYTTAAPTRNASTLEQCKFNMNCTNPACPRRHAISAVACREGSNCKLPYCSFNHPIEEACRFGSECKSNPCYFRHPDEREKALFTNGNGQPAANSVNNPPANNSQVFAVPEDQVMEQVVQQ